MINIHKDELDYFIEQLESTLILDDEWDEARVGLLKQLKRLRG